eukprot:s4755_g1.t1
MPSRTPSSTSIRAGQRDERPGSQSNMRRSASSGGRIGLAASTWSPGQGHRESRDSKGKGKSSGAGQLVRLRLLSDSLRRMVILSQTVW